MRILLLLCLTFLSTVIQAGEALRGTLHELPVEYNGTTRWTHVYQPPGYRSGAPAILLLHGGGQSMHKMFSENAGSSRQWLTIADREKILLLVPNATNADNGDPKGTRQNWNDLRAANATAKTQADDVGFLLQLLAWSEKKFGHDPRRVFVTGASNGGMMTYRLLIEKPQHFTAAAAFIASLPIEGPPKPANTTHVPLMMLNGTQDPLIQWSGGEIAGKRGHTMAIEPMVQWWRDLYGLADVRAVTESLPDRDPSDGCRIQVSRWATDSAGSAPIVFYRVEGGGHALPSIHHPLKLGPIARRLIGPVCRDAEGAELAWDFFKPYAQPTH